MSPCTFTRKSTDYVPDQDSSSDGYLVLKHVWIMQLFIFQCPEFRSPLLLSSPSSIGHIMPLSNLLRTLQVFPLLIKKFSREEQADLVWQFLCSIPVHMMAEFLPWISASVSPDENQDILDCLHKIVPEEKLLQEVLMIMTSCTLASIYKSY